MNFFQVPQAGTYTVTYHGISVAGIPLKDKIILDYYIWCTDIKEFKKDCAKIWEDL